ncbi:MAG: hypothetical protein WKF31_05560 [Thermoleophilaceae bacterium]
MPRRSASVALLARDLLEPGELLGAPALGRRRARAAELLEEALEHPVHERAAVHRVDALDLLGLLDRAQPEDPPEEELERAQRVGLEARGRHRAGGRRVALERLGGGPAEGAVVGGEEVGLEPGAVRGPRACEVGARGEDGGAEGGVGLEEGAVVLVLGEGVGRARRRRCGRRTRARSREIARERLDLLGEHRVARDRLGRGAEEARGSWARPSPDSVRA